MGLAVATACTLSPCDLHVRAAGKTARVVRASQQFSVAPNVQPTYDAIREIKGAATC